MAKKKKPFGFITFFSAYREYIVLIFLYLLFLFPLLHPGVFVTHDGENHIARFASYVRAFMDGQFPPRWAGNLNYGYGTPLFIFFYPLPGYLASLLQSAGVSLETCFKLLSLFAFLLAPIGFFTWTRFFLGKKAAFIASLLYGLAPYHFLDLYVRGDIGELLSFVFIPWVFYFLEKNYRKITIENTLLGGVMYAFLILSHNIMALLFSILFAGYIILKIKHGKTVSLGNVLMLGVGLLLSSFFWIPALLEQRYLNTALFVEDLYKSHFPNLSQLIFSPWGFGSDVNTMGGLSPQIGVIHLAGVILALCFIKQIVKNKGMDVVFWVSVFFCAMFMSLSVSTILWENLPLLKQFQFPWKFTVLSSFAAALICGFVFDLKMNKYIYTATVLGIIITSFYFTRVSGYIHRNDSFYFNFPGTTYYHGEASTRWTAGDFSEKPKSQVEIVSGSGSVKQLSNRSHVHSFVIDAKSDVEVLDNTVYFPGWKVKTGETHVPIEFQNVNHRGLITFKLPKGKHNVLVMFTESRIRMIANGISIFSLLLLILCWLLRKKLNHVLTLYAK